jgi:hypothetical protein
MKASATDKSLELLSRSVRRRRLLQIRLVPP